MPFLFLAVLALVLNPLTIFAQTADTAVQAQCFDTLKQNMVEAQIFEEPLLELGTMSYQAAAAEFSDKYKSMQSFEVGVAEPVFSIRLMSFGEQTGYTHPPKSFFPNYTRSDVWQEPASEFIFAEEYVTDPSGNEHFVNCLFLQIESEDLAGVTGERYAYDGMGISLVKEAVDGSYKAHYAENPSFDYEDKQFVNWKRMFVYPQAANNSYFNRYDVASGYPANFVGDFTDLAFFNQDLVTLQDFDPETGAMTVEYATLSEDAEEFAIVDSPDSLQPVTGEGINVYFPWASYFQTIEAAFPEFSKLLSLRGSLQYSTYKDLIVDPTPNPELVKFMEVFGDPRPLTTYYLEKTNPQSGVSLSSEEFDRQILLAQNANWTVAQLENGAAFATLVYSGEAAPDAPAAVPAPEARSSAYLLFATGVSFVGVLVILRYLRRRYIANTYYEES